MSQRKRPPEPINPDEPQRSPDDGEVQVYRVRPNDGELSLCVTHKGERQAIVCTDWNARRLLAMLSMMLGIPLADAELTACRLAGCARPRDVSTLKLAESPPSPLAPLCGLGLNGYTESELAQSAG